MSCRLNRSRTSLRHASGFSMIEVLISLVLIAIAMLGAANLQLQALKMGKGAAFRMHAVTLAMEIAERIEANRTGAIAGAYATSAAIASPPDCSTTRSCQMVPGTCSPTSAVCGATSALPDCSAASCDANALAQSDLVTWEASLASRLPGARWSIVNTTPGNPSTYTIVVGWQDRRTSNSSTADDQTAATDFLTFTMTRTVAQ